MGGAVTAIGSMAVFKYSVSFTAGVVCCSLVYGFNRVFFFFFQAEDGIRDRTVTGVQTCALPIFKELVPEEYPRLRAGQILFTYLHLAPAPELTRALSAAGTIAIAYETVQRGDGKIGRASCRERGWGEGRGRDSETRVGNVQTGDG